jgi:hypothetical protein
MNFEGGYVGFASPPRKLDQAKPRRAYCPVQAEAQVDSLLKAAPPNHPVEFLFDKISNPARLQPPRYPALGKFKL